MLNQTSRSDFHSLLDARVLRDEDDSAPALIYVQTNAAPQTITRQEFRQQTGIAAAALQSLGIQAGDLVIVAHVQNVESIYLFWGALRMGAIPSMFPTLTEKLDRALYMSSMATLVAHSGAKAILTSDDFADELRARVGAAVYGSSDLNGTVPTPDSFHTATADSIAFLQHSSGTTGLQKGVALSHEAVLNQLAHYAEALRLHPSDVIVSWLPLYHDMGLIAGFLLPLVQGIPLVLMSPFDWVRHPALLLRAIHTYGGTLCWLPNFAYNHCARRIRQRDVEGLSLASVRAFINCSEPVRHDSHTTFFERFAPLGVSMAQLSVSYAMAENTFAVTQTPIGQAAALDRIDRGALETEGRAIPSQAADAAVQVSCGYAIPATQLKVVDEARQSLPERRVGEIAIRSDCMLTGYYQRPDLNADLLHEGWYATGDMGYMADGQLYIVGRKKDLIISGGKNVYPQDIEAIVNGVAGVHPGRAVAFGVYDDKEGTELIGIVAEVDDPSDKHALAAQIRAAVAQSSTVTASYVHLVDETWLIKTSSGKIARAANRDKWMRETGYTLPSDNAEGTS